MINHVHACLRIPTESSETAELAVIDDNTSSRCAHDVPAHNCTGPILHVTTVKECFVIHRLLKGLLRAAMCPCGSQLLCDSFLPSLRLRGALCLACLTTIIFLHVHISGMHPGLFGTFIHCPASSIPSRRSRAILSHIHGSCKCSSCRYTEMLLCCRFSCRQQHEFEGTEFE